MNHHTEVINHVIKTKGFKRYLEIGTQHGVNFKAIECAFKMGVDPDPLAVADTHLTSTEFFAKNVRLFDCVFLDGLHEAHQVRNDFIDAMACLSEKGIIILHDSNPTEQIWTEIPRISRQWTGDVYKFIGDLRADFVTLPFDYGITVVKRGPYVLNHNALTWPEFDARRNHWLKIVDEQQFNEWLQI